MFLETDELTADIFHRAQCLLCIFKSLILEHQKLRQFLLVQLLHPAFNVFGKHKFQELFLFIVQEQENIGLRPCHPLFPGDGLHSKRDIFKHVEKVALFSVYQSFHSFLCDDPETYDYSERSWTRRYGESELRFVRNQGYFWETINLGNERHRRMPKRKRINAIDFDRFPVKVYPTAKETFDRESKSPVNEKFTLSEALSSAEELAPEYEAEVRYKEAFRLFCNLKNLDRKLYNQIRLYVFAGNLREFNEVYRNDNAPIAFYFSILESQAGDPPTCLEPLHCNICGRDIKNHGTSIEKHFIQKYGTSFQNLRKIRHKFFHQGEYSSISEDLWNIYDQRQDAHTATDNPALAQELNEKEESLDDFESEAERLQKIARRTLIESFMHHYSSLGHDS